MPQSRIKTLVKKRTKVSFPVETSGKTFGNYSGLQSLQLDGKLQSITTAIPLQSVCSLADDCNRITQNMCPGQILLDHMLVHCVISHCLIAFIHTSFIASSLSPHFPPIASYCLPRDCVAFLTA